jgi:hypothetical protein
MKKIRYIYLIVFIISFNYSFGKEFLDTNKYAFNVQGLYFQNKHSRNFLFFGIGLEKTNIFKPKKTIIFNFYNTYWHRFVKTPPNNEGNIYSSFRFSFLSYGVKYNLLKKHQLNFGIHAGGFGLDKLTMIQYAHVYGICVNPQIEFKYSFRKFYIGSDINLYQLFGHFKTYSKDNILTIWDHSYFIFEKSKIGFGLNASLNLNFTIKL